MNCSDIEILLAEYVDGTLQSGPKAAVMSHLASCAGCRELAEDAACAVGFIARTAPVEPPPELLTRILFQAPAVKPTWARRLFGRVLGVWIEPILQPRLAMGMGVAALSFFMLRPGVRQLTLSDLDPVKVWTSAENRASRVWERGVKSYENLRLVYDVETRVSQWREEAPVEQAAPAEAVTPPGNGGK
ncbi:MAG TPA: zf-HC2 domain-containing protein [Bryobacteraceae bacterium]